MSKIKTFSMVSLRNPITYPQFVKPAYKSPDVWGGNLNALSTGVHQRINILPKDLTLAGNKKRIGTYNPNILDQNVNNTWVESTPRFFTRTVRIFMPDINRMHNVPSLTSGESWCIQYERIGVWKNPCMGWTYVNDNQSKRLVKLGSLEEAIAYCKQLGLGYEIDYPHFRYHTKKNYGDNFKWKGLPKPDVEDI